MLEQIEPETIFAVYLNHARLNAYLTLCHISERLGLNTTNEHQLASMALFGKLTDQKDPQLSRRIFGCLKENFRMLEPVAQTRKHFEADKDKADELSYRAECYSNVLKLMLKALNKKRNEYCHYKSGDVTLTQNETNELCEYLNNCFDASVNEIKNRKNLSDEDVFHLRRKTSEKRNGKNIVVANPNFHQQFKDENGLTAKGLIYLTSLFLDKKDAYHFLKKQNGFKRSETSAEKATIEAYCAYRIRLPKPTIKSDTDLESLALDMFNDLVKCPKEIFDMISKNLQDTFTVPVTAENTEDGEYAEEILLRRYSDRFPYFALRYCDESNAFENLRFHIDLGKYYFKFYPKTTIDSQERRRALDKKLKTFGRLGEVKAMVETQWKDITMAPQDMDEDSSEPFKAASEPHYHIVDNQIGISIKGDTGLPDVRERSKKTLEKPDAWLSIYELPGMMFYGMIAGFDKVNWMILQYVKKQREICEKIVGTGEVTSDGEFLPYAISKQKKASDKYGETKLQRMIDETDQRLKALLTTMQRMEGPGNKPGKKKFFDIKPGKIGDYLANDMLALQDFASDKDGSDKITSLDFQTLQSSLAFFGAKKELLKDMFRKSGLIESPNPHPFLGNINPAGYKGIVSFYEAYLRERLSFLSQCKRKGDLEHKFLRPTRKSYSQDNRDNATIAQRLSQNPINLPKNFFCAKIKESLGERPDAPMNTACLMQKYFEAHYGQPQPMYGFKRQYGLVAKRDTYVKKESKLSRYVEQLKGDPEHYRDDKKIIAKIPDQPIFADYKRNLLKGCQDIEKNEKAIRRYKVQDMITFMMAEKVLKDRANGDFNLRLSSISPDHDSLFNVPVEYRIPIKIRLNTKVDYEKNYISFIEDKGLCYQLVDKKYYQMNFTLLSTQSKLKDFGKHHRYINDRRVPGLLLWNHENSEVTIDFIHKEIESYDRKKLEVAGMLFELERSVIDKLDPSATCLIDFNRVMQLLHQDNASGCKEKMETILQIRNAIYHNQIPPRFDDKIMARAAGNTVAEKLADITAKFISDIQADNGGQLI